MSSNTSPDASALPWQEQPARRGRAARKGDHYDDRQSTNKEPTDCYPTNTAKTLEFAGRGDINGC